MKNEQKNWLRRFPLLAEIKGSAWDAIMMDVRIVEITEGEILYHIGDSCENYLLVLEGCVRVQMCSETGHEIVLYRVEEGQSCIMTTSCLLSNESYPAEAVAETSVKAVVFGSDSFENALATLVEFRKFVFTAYAKRVADLIYLVNAVAFERMDVRLANVLLQRAGGRQELKITHQEIANELGTAREVVSRLLKEFERGGLIETHRGRLIIKNQVKLKNIGQF